jgi:hypothetical protein
LRIARTERSVEEPRENPWGADPVKVSGKATADGNQ